jgi:parallel beta-helix repeat protein
MMKAWRTYSGIPALGMALLIAGCGSGNESEAQTGSDGGSNAGETAGGGGVIPGPMKAFEDGDAVAEITIEGNDIRGNRVGLRLQNSNVNKFRENRIVGNITGIWIGSASRRNTLTRNRIGPNLHQVERTGPVPPTRWSVDGVGNRWHGAMPLDLNGDGVFEWPHHEVELLAEKRDRFPLIRLLTASPGVRALEWALHRAPVPGMRSITDPDPLTAGG